MTALAIVLASTAYASDVDVYEVALMNYNASGSPKTLDIRFSVAQDNTFTGTDANSQSYYDRVYIFVKYWKSTWDGNTAWKHATLAAGGTISPTTDGKGAFSSPGTNQSVRWAIGTDETVDGTESFKVRVFAIEMVLVPTGSFELGDGNATTESTDAFHVTDNTKVGTIGTALVQNIKVDVNTYDDDVMEGTTPSNGIGIDGDGGIDYSSPQDGVIDNANFPTGYNAFYIMKYEISQSQYVNFLNTLTRVQ